MDIQTTTPAYRYLSWDHCRNKVYLFAAGFSFGWFIGLSSAPVIQGVVVALTGIVVSIAAIYTTSRGITDALHNSPVFLACLLVGSMLGSSAGLLARTHNLFGVSLAALKRELTGVGFTDNEAMETLLSDFHTNSSFRSGIFYSASSPIAGGSKTSPPRDNVVRITMELPRPTFDLLENAKDNKEKACALLRSSPDHGIRNFAMDKSTSDEALMVFLKEIIIRNALRY